ncbi:hypothetical protein HY449_03880 [Candidatus Pacearchaeota archaeon]|nr:hypothetical protein [Candidatus Pacearchaeota archaeon]
MNDNFKPSGKICIGILSKLTEQLGNGIRIESATVDATGEFERCIDMVLSFDGYPRTLEEALKKISTSFNSKLFVIKNTFRCDERDNAYYSCYKTDYELVPQGEARINVPDIKIISYTYESKFRDAPF